MDLKPKTITDIPSIYESKVYNGQGISKMEENFENNAFIFNWVQDNNEKVALLKKTLEHFDNHVEIFNHPTYKELIVAVDQILRKEFALYNYIVVIILDNKSKSERFIETSDGIQVLLYSEILTVIQTNKTLQNKPRLFVIQKLLDWSDFDDEDDDEDEVSNSTFNATEQVTRRNALLRQIPYYKQRKTLYQGLTVAIKAKEFHEDFDKSPFVETFCKEFLQNANTVTIDKIYSMILKDIKGRQKYKDIDIEFETNQTNKDSLIFGPALSTDELRDFF